MKNIKNKKKSPAIKPLKAKISGKVKAKTTIKEIIKIKGADEILAKHGVPCLSCPMAKFEIDRLEIGRVCSIYGLNLKKILEDLNKN